MRIQPNTRLKEDGWAEKLNLGLLAIREALNRLLGEGLVTTGEIGDYMQTDREHRQLIEAIKNKNLKRAKEVLMSHFKRGELAVLDLG
ncbi:MAG: hypothetical protein HKN87_12755 [Saprospiraceae bacterium]|nr:hypothetical protein [Saprospiraceae bacterium]